jgi:hypothetical protein
MRSDVKFEKTTAVYYCYFNCSSHKASVHINNSMPVTDSTTKVCGIARFIVMLVLTITAFSQVTFARQVTQQSAPAQSAPPPQNAAPGLDTLPPRPPGKSTVIGGAIQNVDPVRDQFTLKVFGGKPMKILFDERTQIYRDGKRAPLRDLRPDDHASVETVLDGTKVFALSVHVLSQLPEGERQGQVMDYNSEARELTVSDIMGQGPLKLKVPIDTPILHVGQAASTSRGTGTSDLVKGTLVSVKFKSDNQGRGIASQISVLATPGSAFVFSGNITFLDLRSKVLVLVDPTTDSSYKINFDPVRLPLSKDLHEGERVRVTATFDGGSYVATGITTF